MLGQGPSNRKQNTIFLESIDISNNKVVGQKYLTLQFLQTFIQLSFFAICNCSLTAKYHGSLKSSICFSPQLILIFIACKMGKITNQIKRVRGNDHFRPSCREMFTKIYLYVESFQSTQKFISRSLAILQTSQWKSS